MEPLDVETCTVENLDGFPSDVIIAVLAARLGGSVTIGLDRDMGRREGIYGKDLSIHIDLAANTIEITLKDVDERLSDE